MNSEFQFLNPVLVELDFKLNKEFQTDEKNIQIKSQISVAIDRKDDTQEAVVRLKVVIGSKDESSPFYILAIEQSKFRWDASISEEDVDGLLNVNAPALLLSYLRPIISQITASSPYNAYNIPFMNFNKNK